MANPFFNAAFYLQSNPDLVTAGITAATAEQHYNNFGAAEGRAPTSWFNGQFYLNAYPDLAASGVNLSNAFAHFQAYGANEGRSPTLGVQLTPAKLGAYAAANSDLAFAYGVTDFANPTPAQQIALTNHFYTYGVNEDRAGSPLSAQTFTLTTGIDAGAQFVGTAGNDLFNGNEFVNATGAVLPTFTALDSLDGGAGIDTLRIVQSAAIDTAVPGVSVKNIEIVDLTSASTVTANTTAWAGVTTLNVNSASNVAATAAATTDVTVNASALAGAGGNELVVNGGKAITVTASDSTVMGTATLNNIVVGGTTAAAGAVKVTYTETVADGTDTGIAGGDITVTGGTAVEVNSLAVAGAGSAAGDVLTLGKIDVNGNASTTEVTVKQSAATALYNGTTQKNISIANGAVNIIDGNTATTAADTIKTVTLENFGAARIDSTVLQTLNLTAGATIASGAVTLNKTTADTSTAVTTLALNTSGSFGKISGSQADVYKTVNVTAAAATTIADIEMNELTTLNVAGAGVTTFTALTAVENAKLATITSTGGGLTINTKLGDTVAVTGGAGVETISIGATTKVIDLGAGNDVVTISEATLGAGGAVKGGDGVDTLVANTNGSAIVGLPAFSGFETLRVAGTSAQGVHNAVGFTALEVGVTAGLTTFTSVAAGVGLTVLAPPNAAGTVVTLADATGKADSFALTLRSADTLAADSVTVAGVETVNITNTDTNVTVASGLNVNTLELNAAAATTVNISGNTTLQLTGTSTSIVTLDASGLVLAASTSNGLSFTSGNTAIGAKVSITGSNGIDILTGANVATGVDTINGGAGNDVITGLAGNDVLTGGAGNDTFTFVTGVGAAAVAANNGTDTITDFISGGGVDVLNVNALLGGAGVGFLKGTSTAAEAAGNVIVVTNNIGATLTAADIDALTATLSNTLTSGVVALSNNGVVQLWYDADIGTAGGASEVTLIGTLSGTSLAQLADLTVANFA